MATLDSLITKDSTVFVYDRKQRFAGYFSSLLCEKVFSPPEEREKILEKLNLKTGRKPCCICDGKDLSPLISFAKKDDILLYVYIDGDCSEVLPVLRTAKALGLKTLLLSSLDLKEEAVFADFYKTYRKDAEAIEFCAELAGALCSSSATQSRTPFPIAHCGLSHAVFSRQLDEKTFAAYKENGISHMEISFGGYDDTVNLDFKEYKRLADKYGITLWSFHLPFMPFTTIDPAHFDETVRKFTVGYFIELMKEAKRDAGISLFVIHPSGEPIHEDDRTASFNQLKKSISELVAFADKNEMTLAVENLPRSCLGRNSEDMQKILGIHPSLKMCFDINHAGAEHAPDIIKRFKERIITLHISDYMGKDECHLMPGEGVVDWVETVRSLKAIGYKGPFLYEISRGKEEDGVIWATETLGTRLFTRQRFLDYKDIKENFEHIMNKAK